MYRRTLLLTLAAIPLLVGQEKQRVQAEFHQSYPMQPGSKLTVDNLNGSVEISGWDQSTLDVSATRYAETQPSLDALKIDIAVGSEVARSSARSRLGARRRWSQVRDQSASARRADRYPKQQWR